MNIVFDMKRTCIIAEAGVNHNGSLETAMRLVDAAAEAGADIVKFQTFKAEAIVSKDAEMAEYQKANIGRTEGQYEMLKRLELSPSDHEVLMERCKEKNILFFSTAFDVEGVRYLNKLGLPFMKVPSGELTNLPYLREINRCGKPVFLSTGMSTMQEVAEAVEVLDRCEVTLLHCTTEYPCPVDAVNLNAMLTMKERFDLPVGYSDHTQGLIVPVAAVSLGACVIEKHFTLDRSMEGPDHRASLEPSELKEMVDAIRKVEAAFGSGVKEPSEAEKKNIVIARKSIVAKTFIAKGDRFSEDNLTVKRPGNGISPMFWDSVVGRTAGHDYRPDEKIEL